MTCYVLSSVLPECLVQNQGGVLREFQADLETTGHQKQSLKKVFDELLNKKCEEIIEKIDVLVHTLGMYESDIGQTCGNPAYENVTAVGVNLFNKIQKALHRMVNDNSHIIDLIYDKYHNGGFVESFAGEKEHDIKIIREAHEWITMDIQGMVERIRELDAEAGTYDYDSDEYDGDFDP